MTSSPDFDAFADDGIDLGDLEGDTSGLKELFANSKSDRLGHGSTPQPRSPHGGAEKRPQLPDSVIPMERTVRVPILLLPIDKSAITLTHSNNQVVLASVRRHEKLSADVPQNAPAARRPSVDVTRKQLLGNNCDDARMLLPPKSGLPAPSNSSANGVGGAPRPSGHAGDAKKKAQHQPGQRDAKAVDIETSTRFDNISNNILAHLQCMMDTFHSFELSPVFLNYIRYDHKGKNGISEPIKFRHASIHCTPPIFKRALCTWLWTGRSPRYARQTQRSLKIYVQL